MLTSREIIEQGNKKRLQEEWILQSSECSFLPTRDIIKTIDENFIDIHNALINAAENAPLLKNTFNTIDELCNDFKKIIFSEEKNENGLRKVESLKTAISSTLNATVSCENKLKAISTFELLSQSSLNKADQDKKRTFYLASSVALVLAGVLLGLAITAILVATGGIAAACLVVGAVAGMGLQVGITLGFAKNLSMPSSIGGKLKQVSQHGLFAQKPKPMPKQKITFSPKIN